MQTWLLYAMIAAVTAALVGIFGKAGMKGIDSDLATAMRGCVQVACLLAVVTARGIWPKVTTLHRGAVLAIILSGMCGAASWLFAFKAINDPAGGVSKVAPIDKLSVPIAAVLAVVVFSEKVTPTNWVGIGLIAVGAYLAAVKW